MHFAEGGAGDGIDANELPRHLERCKIFAARSLEIHSRCVADDVGNRHLASNIIGNADDCRFANSTLLREQILDLARIDVEPA